MKKLKRVAKIKDRIIGTKYFIENSRKSMITLTFRSLPNKGVDPIY
jgi:hypothetical protein